jgi:hypothetical protein
MRYYLELAEKVKTQLRLLPGLSREGRIKLFFNLDLLKDISDDDRLDPLSRDPTAANQFFFGLLMRDRGRVRHFVFVVDDAAAVAGVLRVRSVEDNTPPPTKSPN